MSSENYVEPAGNVQRTPPTAHGATPGPHAPEGAEQRRKTGEMIEKQKAEQRARARAAAAGGTGTGAAAGAGVGVGVGGGSHAGGGGGVATTHGLPDPATLLERAAPVVLAQASGPLPSAPSPLVATSGASAAPASGPAETGSVKKVVYLTFDDDPIVDGNPKTMETTEKLLGYLEKAGLKGKATFFLIGSKIALGGTEATKLVERIRTEYVIGNHSNDHWLSESDYASREPAKYVENFVLADPLVLGTSGKVQFTRLPGNNPSSKEKHAEALQKDGRAVFGWHYEPYKDPNDPKGEKKRDLGKVTTADVIAEIEKLRKKDHIIVLFHAGQWRSHMGTLEAILKALAAKYDCRPLTLDATDYKPIATPSTTPLPSASPTPAASPAP